MRNGVTRNAFLVGFQGDLANLRNILLYELYGDFRPFSCQYDKFQVLAWAKFKKMINCFHYLEFH